MNETKQRRYPADRLKLHTLLEKKRKQLEELQKQVEELQKLVQTADATAINATAALYNVTPEQLSEIMRKLYGDKAEPEPVHTRKRAAAPKNADRISPEKEAVPDENT